VSLTAANVERAAGDAPPAVLGQLALGTTVTVSVRFGPEGSASVGATIIVDCPDVQVAPGTATRPAPATATPPAPEVEGVTVSRALPDVVVTQPNFTG
jgi:hypothetical protein